MSWLCTIFSICGIMASAEVTMVRVVDGDTIIVAARPQNERMRVRFLGVDTPEINGRCAREIRLAKAASKRTSELLPKGARIILRSDSARFNLDKHGRVLARIERNGLDIGQTLIKEGHARVWLPPPAPRNDWCS